MEAYFDLRRWKFSKELNEQKVQILKKFVDQQQFESQAKQNTNLSIYKIIRARDIEIGDILFIQKNEILPADVILLEMSDSSCCLNSSFNEGLTTQRKIIPPSITYISKSSKIKGLHFDYKKILNGNIEYVSSEERDKNKFEGFVKLSKDPQGTVITQQNIGYRGSVLEYADWALGIVIYCGHDCFYYKKKQEKQHRVYSYFNSKSGKLFVVSLFFYVFASIVSVVNYFTNSCYPGLPEFNSQGERYRDTSTGKIGLSYMYDYILFLPQFYYFITDLKTLVFAIYQNKYYDYNKCKSIKQFEFFILFILNMILALFIFFLIFIFFYSINIKSYLYNQFQIVLQEEDEEQVEVNLKTGVDEKFGELGGGIKEEEGESKSKIYSDKESKQGIDNKVDSIIKQDKIVSSFYEVSDHDKNNKSNSNTQKDKKESFSSQKIQKQKNKQSNEKPYIYQINSSKPLADLTLTTHCFIDKTGTLTQGRSFMIHKMYLEDCSYFISENYLDPIFKSHLNTDQISYPAVDNLNNNDKQIDNIFGFKKSNSLRNESPHLGFTNNQLRQNILNTNFTQITALNTDNQNDIVGEEGIFLRQKLPYCHLSKRKSDLESLILTTERADSQHNILNSPTKKKKLHIDTTKIIAKDFHNFKNNDDDQGDQFGSPSNNVNKKISQQSLTLKSQGQIKSSIQITQITQQSYTESKRLSINQVQKKSRKISFAEELERIQGESKQLQSEQNILENNLQSARILKFGDNFMTNEDQKEGDTDRFSNQSPTNLQTSSNQPTQQSNQQIQIPSNQQIQTLQSKSNIISQLNNTNIANSSRSYRQSISENNRGGSIDFLNGKDLNYQNQKSQNQQVQDTISEKSYGSSKRQHTTASNASCKNQISNKPFNNSFFLGEILLNQNAVNKNEQFLLFKN